MKNKKQHSKTFSEVYVVNFSFKDCDSGFYKFKEEEVYLKIQEGQNGKDRHNLAALEIAKKYKNQKDLSIKSVVYV